jgi:hypothetical protein
VIDEVVAALQLPTDVVLANHVPTMQDMFVAKVRDELGHRHVPAGLWNGGGGLAIEDFSDETTHLRLLRIQPL